MLTEKKTVLVTVKAYPNPSRKYGETVCYAGVDLSTGEWIRLFPIPFKCDGVAECPGHKMSIVDWELGQSYRSWRRRYPDRDTLLEKIQERWLNLICSEKNDVYFYVGNMKRFRTSFMVLGVFYPPL